MIGQTPLLEFKVEALAGTPQNVTVDKNGKANLDIGSRICFDRINWQVFTKSYSQF